MKMSKFEKRIVNQKKNADRNIKKLEECLEVLKKRNIRNTLEIGGGFGLVATHLVNKYNWKVIGTDIDPEQVELAKQTNPVKDNLSYQVADATNLIFEDKSFDLIFSQMVFHHIKEWERAVFEVFRVLKPGGHFIWYDVALPAWIRYLFASLLKNHGLYSYDEISTCFDKAGFEQIWLRKEFFGPFRVQHRLMQKPIS